MVWVIMKLLEKECSQRECEIWHEGSQQRDAGSEEQGRVRDYVTMVAPIIANSQFLSVTTVKLLQLYRNYFCFYYHSNGALRPFSPDSRVTFPSASPPDPWSFLQERNRLQSPAKRDIRMTPVSVFRAFRHGRVCNLSLIHI